jgi:hypothetical protein
MSDLEIVGWFPKPSSGYRKKHYVAKILNNSQAETMNAICAAIDR